MMFKIGDRVCIPDGREGVVSGVGDLIGVDLGGVARYIGPGSTLTFAVPPIWATTLPEARRVFDAIEAAAEAAHDRFYEVCADTSDLGYAFQDEKCKRAWREVAIAVLQVVGGQR